MEERDRKGFLVLIAMLSEAFKEEMSSERAKIYYEFLKPYSLYQIMQSIQWSIKHLKWFPKIADLHEFIDPEDGYKLIESDKTKEFRLKNEEKVMLEYVREISSLIGRKRESNIKALENKI